MKNMAANSRKKNRFVVDGKKEESLFFNMRISQKARRAFDPLGYAMYSKPVELAGFAVV